MGGDLRGRRVLVTGGTHGIGRGVTAALLEAAASVFVVGRTDAHLADCLDCLDGLGGELRGTTADIAVVADARRVVAETVEAFGQVDVLVNVAGVFAPSGVLETTEEDYDRQFDINVKGSYFCTQAAARAMVEAGTRGKVIMISSVAGHRAFPGVSVYCATKAAVEHFTRSFSTELAPLGINVNCVVPGNIDMPTNVLMQEPGAREATAAATPARRNGRPGDIASAVLFLASSDADFVHGASLAVDGGILAAG